MKLVRSRYPWDWGDEIYGAMTSPLLAELYGSTAESLIMKRTLAVNVKACPWATLVETFGVPLL